MPDLGEAILIGYTIFVVMSLGRLNRLGDKLGRLFRSS